MPCAAARSPCPICGFTRARSKGRPPWGSSKGSADAPRGAAALVRGLERRLGRSVGEVRIAPLRAVDNTIVILPQIAPDTGRLRMLAVGVATRGGYGAGVGPPVWLGPPAAPPGAPAPPPPARAARALSARRTRRRPG